MRSVGGRTTRFFTVSIFGVFLLLDIHFGLPDSPQRREERRGFLAGELCVLPVSAVPLGVSFGGGLAALGSCTGHGHEGGVRVHDRILRRSGRRLACRGAEASRPADPA